jgi:leucyl aminopeptidase
MLTLKFGRMTPGAIKQAVVVFADKGQKLVGGGVVADKALKGAVKRSFRAARFSGAAGEFHHLTPGEAVNHVLAVGAGKAAGMERRDWWKAGLGIGKQLDALGVREAVVALGEIGDAANQVEAAEALVEGVHMACYRFDGFKSEVRPRQQVRLAKLTVLTGGSAAMKLNAGAAALQALLEGTDLTRDCGNTPPNVANPEFLADQARKLEKLGVKVTVLDEKDLKKLGMNLILAVGGNAEPKDQPRLVLMEYRGAGKTDELTALVGKGICFDTGGYNIKPGDSMHGMKFDMSGAGTVLGTMRALAARKAKVNVIGVMTCAMNMIAGQPFVVDAIYKSYKGVMVEIGNTDAEGRLVLADALAYAIEKYAPARVINLATLTGAMMVALGGAYAGMFSNNDTLSNRLHKAGEATGERVWRMPLEKGYLSKSAVADIYTIGPRWGGSMSAAEFLWKFVENVPWAHLDIAGTANIDRGVPGAPKELSGASGWGVRLLTRLIEGEFGAATETAVPRRRGRPRKAA